MNESLSLQSDILAQDSFLTSINLVKEIINSDDKQEGTKTNKQTVIMATAIKATLSAAMIIGINTPN